MSFTALPNEAIDRMTELSAGALRLYLFLARCRNQKTGKCCPSVAVTADAIDVHRKNVFKLRNELAAANWARFDGDDVTGLFGFDSSKNATADVEPIEVAPESRKNTTVRVISSKNTTIGSKNATSESQKHYPVVAKTLLKGSKNATAYKEEQDEGTRRNEQDEYKDMSDEASNQVSVPSPVDSLASSPVQQVFAYWQATLNHPTAHLTDKRRKNIQARLKDKYTVEQIKTAIDGCRSSPFHMGQNDRNTVFDDIELICRSGEKLEMFIAKVSTASSGLAKFTPNAQKTVNACESWLKHTEEGL